MYIHETGDADMRVASPFTNKVRLALRLKQIPFCMSIHSLQPCFSLVSTKKSVIHNPEQLVSLLHVLFLHTDTLT
jgi:hypothetical protein